MILEQKPELKDREYGFTLVEVLIASCVLSIGILAVAFMQISAIQGNATACGITDASARAGELLEKFMSLPYNDPLLQDMDGDGYASDQDLDGNGVDDDDEGSQVDGILNFGLDDTGGEADYQQQGEGKCTLYWNVADNAGINNTKTIGVIVTWADRRTQRKASMKYIKAKGM